MKKKYNSLPGQKEKSKRRNNYLEEPCNICVYNNRSDRDYPCAICDNNVGGNNIDERYGDYFEKLHNQSID